jgi:hypothetical protein
MSVTGERSDSWRWVPTIGGDRSGSSSGAGRTQALPTTAATIEPLLIFKGMKEMKERL